MNGDSAILINFLEQLAIVVSAVIIGTQTITAAIKGAFNIQNDNVSHTVSWIVGILGGIGFVAFNGIEFGFNQEWINYICGAFAGFIAGAAANGIYDWPKIKAIFDAITKFFGKK